MNSILSSGNISSRTEAIPHTSVNYLPSKWLLVIPQHPPGGTYIDHCATRLEGEEDVDVSAIGDSSAGGVGQEKLQTADQVPGDAHFNGVRLAHHGDYSTKGLSLEVGNLNGEKVKKASRRTNFTLTQLELFILSPKETSEAKNKLVNKTRTPNSQDGGQMMLLKFPNEEILCLSVSSIDVYFRVWLV